MFYPMQNLPAAEHGPDRGPQARRQREIEALRERILDAAEEILISDGYANLSMRRLADAIEYAPSTIYGYFSDKKAILAAVIERTTGNLLDALEDADATPGPLTRLRMLGRAYVEFALRFPRHYEVLFQLRNPTVPVIETEAFTAAIDRFEAAVAEGVRKGIFRRCAVQATAQAFWASCHGVVSLLLTHQDRYDFVDAEALLEAMLTLQIEGLRPQAFGFAGQAPRREAEPAADAPTPALADSIAATLAQQVAARTAEQAGAEGAVGGD